MKTKKTVAHQLSVQKLLQHIKRIEDDIDPMEVAKYSILGDLLPDNLMERNRPEIKAMRSDSEIERIAVNDVIAHEESQGRKGQSVEENNRGFDLILRTFHIDDPETAINVQLIEMKGRSEIGQVALSDNSN